MKTKIYLIKAFLLTISVIMYSNIYAQTQNAFALKGSKWTTNKIEVTWENPSQNNITERQWVQNAIKETWESVADIEFTNWGTSTSYSKGIRIRIIDDTPHVKLLGNQIDGMREGMVLNFSFNNWSPIMKNRRKDYIIAIAVHEFGHALGFAHEHNRSDCYFCDERSQGTEGDYYITTCDLNSVMNYCNPSYANWGKLSNGDIIGVTTLYGKKRKAISTPIDNDIFIAHTSRNLTESEKSEKPSLEKFLKIYITGSNSALNKIENVVYELHPTFSNRYIVTDERNANFGIGLYVWGMFNIKAEVTFTDGSTKTLSHYLNFDEIPTEINDNNQDIELNHTVRSLSNQEKSESSGNSKEITVFLEASNSFLNKVSYVEYKLHSSFNPRIKTSRSVSSKFKIKFSCWGQFTIRAKVFMKDGKYYDLERYLNF